MSGAADQGQEGAEPAGTVEPQQVQEPGGQGSETLSEYSHANPFLQNVPEADRPLLEPYVKQWDAGVTRKLQEVHSQYEPYKPFMEAEITQEDLASAWNLYRLLEENPNYLYQLLDDERKKGTWGEQGPGQPGAEEVPAGDDPFQGLHPKVAEMLQQQQAALEAVGTWVLEQQGQTQAQQQDKELDDYLTLLRTEFGDFDEKYVIAQMGIGVDPVEAVQQWNQILRDAITRRDQAGQGPGASAPPVLHGGGGFPGGDTDPVSASSKDVRAFTERLLQQANKTKSG